MKTPPKKEVFMSNITTQTSPVLHPHPYSNEQAIILAKCSKIVYSSKYRAEKLLEEISFKLKYYNKNEPPFLIAESDQCIVIAFTGKQKLFDFINILKFFWTEEKVKRIHNGFKNMYDKVHYLILFYLSQLSDKKPIYLTGHSLGGALSVIAASRLTESHIEGCYTFGSPPIGIKELDQPIQRPVYEIMNDNDPFSHLDRSSSNYIGSRYVLTQDQILHNHTGKISKQHNLQTKQLLSTQAFNAHSINEYINRLETILRNAKEKKIISLNFLK